MRKSALKKAETTLYTRKCAEPHNIIENTEKFGISADKRIFYAQTDASLILLRAYAIMPRRQKITDQSYAALKPEHT